ncbi:hypothetical protein MLD38_030330 [Melastoma candidum]|uniref:Uncharacterized protein n=1 Tax=Melastoma candidum TaxID=119954 RepID=A0ACB9MPX7_9MYRT|nr:hypothetical protein MLD38_030330 [Melastoma candidum]
MAASNLSAVPPAFPPGVVSHPPHPLGPSLLCFPKGNSQQASRWRTRVTGQDFWGDFGARDPFPEEIESNFGDKVLGFSSTEHKILIPNASVLSLAEQECSPVSPVQDPMPQEEARMLLKKVVGWRLLDEEGGLKLQCLWKLRDFKCGVELVNRIFKVVEATGHYPSLHLEQPDQVRAELWTSSIGGLSMNDFIVAAKIDKIKTSDLAPKKRVWA